MDPRPDLRRASRLAVTGAVLAGPLLVGGPAQAAGPTVVVTDAGLSPAAVTVPYGTTVTWSFREGTHTVTDATPLGLYASGPRGPGTAYARTFSVAGGYPYRSTVGTALRGRVAVPVRALPTSGARTDSFQLRWSAGWLPLGLSEQVQVRLPGATGWSSLVYGTPAPDTAFRPVDHGGRPGTYAFRARLYRGSDPAAGTGWSPAATITVR